MVSNTRTDMKKALKVLKGQAQIDHLKFQIKEREQKMVGIKNERDHLKIENQKLKERVEILEKQLSAAINM